MKFNNIRVYNFEFALRGMRNPKNSWHLADTKSGIARYENVVAMAEQSGYDLKDISSLTFEEVDKETYTYNMVLKLKNGDVKDITPKSASNDEMKLIVDIFNKNILR